MRVPAVQRRTFIGPTLLYDVETLTQSVGLGITFHLGYICQTFYLLVT